MHLTLDRITGLGIVVDNDRGHISVTILHEIFAYSKLERKLREEIIDFSAFQAHQFNAWNKDIM